MNATKPPIAKTHPVRWRFAYDLQLNQFLLKRDDRIRQFEKLDKNGFVIPFIFPVIDIIVFAPTELEAQAKGFLRVILYLVSK